MTMTHLSRLAATVFVKCNGVPVRKLVLVCACGPTSRCGQIAKLFFDVLNCIELYNIRRYAGDYGAAWIQHELEQGTAIASTLLLCCGAYLQSKIRSKLNAPWMSHMEVELPFFQHQLQPVSNVLPCPLPPHYRMPEGKALEHGYDV